jgi:Tfp pilus assembly protein PilF
MNRIVFLLLSIGSFFASAQVHVHVIDSLRLASVQANSDTVRINLYLQISTHYRRVNLDSMYYFASKARDLSLKINYKRGNAYGHLLMGMSEWRRGNLMPALDLCQTALSLAIDNNFHDLESEALDNVGLVHNYLGDYRTAMEYYQRGLAVTEKFRNDVVKANLLNDLGGLHYNLKDYDRALGFWKKTLALRQQLDDKQGAASSMNNIGLAYADKGDFVMALSYYFKSLKSARTPCDEAYPLENMGTMYYKLKKLDTAEYYLKQALAKSEKCTNKISEINILTSLADVYKIDKRFREALPILEKAYSIGVTSKLNREAAIAAKSLSEVHEKLGNIKDAFLVFKKYQALQDSLYNNENAKAMGKLEAQNEYETVKREQKVAQQLEDLQREKALAREKWIRNTFFGGFVVMIGVAFMTYRNFKKKKMSSMRLELMNREINAQKEALISQAEELRSLNESLNSVNHDLEEKIAERTRQLIDKNTELENKNIKLADYAFINAHKLRAPVATILGLVTLFENRHVSNEERDDIVDKIKHCSGELNAIVREIRVTLEKETNFPDSIQ